jgi:ribosome maturation factor RimP
MGRKSHSGFLQGVDKDNLIILKTEEFEIKIDFLEIDKANIDTNWAIENNIRELLFMRLKSLGYHLIRVKMINVNGKKNIADNGGEN